jgi:hypothetical protein
VAEPFENRIIVDVPWDGRHFGRNLDLLCTPLARNVPQLGAPMESSGDAEAKRIFYERKLRSPSPEEVRRGRRYLDRHPRPILTA